MIINLTYVSINLFNARTSIFLISNKSPKSSCFRWFLLKYSKAWCHLFTLAISKNQEKCRKNYYNLLIIVLNYLHFICCNWRQIKMVHLFFTYFLFIIVAAWFSVGSNTYDISSIIVVLNSVPMFAKQKVESLNVITNVNLVLVRNVYNSVLFG